MNDDIEVIINRYRNDPVFHGITMTMVQALRSGSMNRGDFFDALRIADQIVYEAEMDALKEMLHDHTPAES